MAVSKATMGVLHPGEMGAALGSALRTAGHTVLWSSAGRGPATARRAELAGLSDVGALEELEACCDIIVSVCPPHAALDVARSITGFEGLYLDANAISPESSRAVAALVEANGARFVDGGIVGPPPRSAGTTRLYLSGAAAAACSEFFAGTVLDVRIVSGQVGSASAVKMAYAAWTKGTAALLLAIRALARAESIEAALMTEWSESVTELPEASLRAARSAAGKGWRWVGEMEQIAETFAADGLPSGFHEAAAEIFRRSPRLGGDVNAADALERILAALGPTGADVPPPRT